MREMLAAVFVLFVLIIAGCPQQQLQGGNGRVVFTIADKAADLGAVTSIRVTVESVSVQSVAKGWVTVPSTPKTYDLIQLRGSGKQAVLADAQLEPGAYNQVRLHISKVIVVDSQGEHEAKLPSGELKIAGEFGVKANSTSAVTFDFAADESLYVAGNGRYILAPVVRLQTREDANVNVKRETDVEIAGGRQRTDTTVGMDEKGNMGVNFRIPADVEISIEGNGIKIGGNVSVVAAPESTIQYTCGGSTDGTCPAGQRCSPQPLCDENGCMAYHCYDETYIGPPLECANQCGEHTLAITTSSVPSGVTGTNYSTTIAATGGPLPYSWSMGTLPPGLEYDTQTGAMTGNPTFGTACGVIDVTVTDSSSAQASVSFPITIECTGEPECQGNQPCVPPQPKQLLSIATSSLPSGVTGTPYSETLQATGGSPPYTWSKGGCGPVVPSYPPPPGPPGFYGDPLPEGLSLSSSGEISGTPQCFYTTWPTFRVTDSAGAHVDKNLTISTSCPENQMCQSCVGCPV